MWGPVFVDGSCTAFKYKVLNRAAWSVAMVDEQGELVARISGTVWASLPQTPQAAEYVALGAAAELCTKEAWIYDDCSNVVPLAV